MKAAISYSFNAKKSAQLAQKILKAFDNDPKLEEVNAETFTGEEFASYDFLILGVPTWFDGELPNYWDELLPDLEDKDLKGKKVAIFGAGDQLNYPENFVDAIGLMADFLEQCGAQIIGFTSTEGYRFESSQAQRGDQFCGLALDYENQARMHKGRIDKWVKQLKAEL